jgi:AbrB family looped-hinge helix DNA binding protein
MADIATTRMSSKGQIVIPESIRKQLKLQTGAQFIVLGEKDVVILKNLTTPSLNEFGRIVSKARKAGKQAGIKKSDVEKTILEARKRK